VPEGAWVTNNIVELGLKRPGQSGPENDSVTSQQPQPAIPVPAPSFSRADAPLSIFVERLIGVLATVPPEAEVEETSEFRSKLEEYRHVILDPSRYMEVPRVTEACVAACQKYLTLSRQYHTDRESELAEMITILRDAAKISIGSSSEFHVGLIKRTENFGLLVHVDDIRELKRKLAQEVSSLRQSVEEKQKKDEQAYAALTSKVEALQSRLSQVEEEASTDPLTRISNRGHFQRTFTRWFSAAKESGGPLSVAMFDVDNFKQINDTHGHPIGDRVLLCTAQALSKGLRQTDFVARYGGEEFVVLLSNAGVSQVEERLIQLVESIAASSYDYDLLGKRETVRFTVSCGLTDLQPNDSEEDLIKRADEALYEAKRKGKNRVITKKRSLFGSLMSWG
jgi:diguanylate cyclase (GGDEF)-like protein